MAFVDPSWYDGPNRQPVTVSPAPIVSLIDRCGYAWISLLETIDSRDMLPPLFLLAQRYPDGECKSEPPYTALIAVSSRTAGKACPGAKSFGVERGDATVGWKPLRLSTQNKGLAVQR